MSGCDATRRVTAALCNFYAKFILFLSVHLCAQPYNFASLLAHDGAIANPIVVW